VPFVTTLLNPKALVLAVAVIPFGRPDVGSLCLVSPPSRPL
jgi:hypothetical protein